MPRIRTIPLDNLQFPIAPMTYDEMETYLKRLSEMKAAPNTPQEDYAAITLDTVVDGLNRASGNKDWTRAKLTAEVDSGSINELYDAILKMSGIVVKTAGEAAATSTSR